MPRAREARNSSIAIHTVAHDHVDRDELPEERGIDLEDFLHRRLVGTTADPAAGQRGHAAPGLAGHGLRMDEAHRENDTSAPSITPTVPVRNITTPSARAWRSPPMSIDTQNSTSDAGSR